ncbi:hypothetical protein N5C55_19675 [Pseudomonas otitidis]|uniref:hypothetical protein n=1 Tax=Metapseudomonas otitidis TaxID=319939 RepID=UPI0020973582|nr:hypothetical protein [Pseudomonas otitidis]MCO7552432.1 hypothetical protein [Pseudomonas otitidis]MDH1109494.1 hypothetical protein [Pseudomonas otitidis]MDH1160394.1 hypothetical protein [Pseudomonas otitidis]MDH1166503.1 hypothetical protein [Pseudomonas otitidis]
MRISMNVGLSEGQLRQVSEVLTQRVDADSGGRAMEALLQALPPEKKQQRFVHGMKIA